MSASATMDDVADRGGNGSQRTGRNLKRGAERFAGRGSVDFADLIADVEDLVQKVGYIADGEIAQVRERVQEKISRAKESLADQGLRIVTAARNVAGATDEYVHENPWQSTGMAALAGVVLGFLIFRK
jgi:ElaB/YqjD/DUF883 family membrane-anchored ribosome-binding protein